MNTLGPLIATALLLFAGSSAFAADKPTRAEKNEAKLAELLKGRVAGEPVTCIPTFQADELQVIDGLAMVYGKGDTLYVADIDCVRRFVRTTGAPAGEICFPGATFLNDLATDANGTGGAPPTRRGSAGPIARATCTAV